MADQAITTIYEAFKQTVARFKHKTSLIYLGKKFTYAELEELVEQLGQALYNLGIRKGDRVMVYLPHVPQWVTLWLAVQRIGAIAVPVTHFYGHMEVKYISTDSGAETICCMDTNFGYVSRIFAETPLKRIIVCNVTDHLPLYKTIIGKIYNKIPEGGFGGGENIITYKNLLKAGKSAPPLPPIKVEGTDIAEMLYTGGTTGFPKGVPISHVLFLQSLEEQRKAGEALVPRGEDVIIQGAPLYHILGQAVGFGALFSGDTVILLPRMNLDAIFDHIQRFKVKTFFGTPTLYRMVLEHNRVDLYDLSSLKYNFCGGDVLPREVARRWYNKFGKKIYVGYGATETCGGVSLVPTGIEDFPEDSAGKIVSFQKVMIVDPETMEAVPPGEAGELLVSSENMVSGYWNKPEETANFFVELQGRLWYKTGDMVRVDEEGWLFFTDRSVDIIKHKGYRVAASKVEAALQEHSAVIASCVVGVPDEKVGERIKAFVVLKEDVKGVTSYELLKWCRDRLSSYEVPQYIEFRDMLPKSKVGKLLRRELRADERRKYQVS
ncbi:MAG: AMP-binding protein [Bacillota bacterium]